MAIAGIASVQNYLPIRERWTSSVPRPAGTSTVDNSSPAGGQQQPQGAQGYSEGFKTSGEASGSLLPAAHKTPISQNTEELDQQEQREVDELKLRDGQVRIHEQAHVAAGGRYVVSGPSYELQEGPDGRKYAVGGEVILDMSAIPDDPEATILKMQTIKSAALAPAEPSTQDRMTAAKADGAAAKARQDMIKQRFQQEGKSPVSSFPTKGSLIDQIA